MIKKINSEKEEGKKRNYFVRVCACIYVCVCVLCVCV